jgi:hypothetical protein
MKSVLDFLDGHGSSNELLILGQCPSSNTKPLKNGTYDRLMKWCNEVNISMFAFHNVIPNKINSYDINDVDEDALYEAVQGKTIVIALGGFVERVCKKYKIDCYKIDHPSPRNRNLNDPKYEKQMLKKLKKYLDDNRNN